MSTSKNSFVVIDAGNTSIKVAEVKNSKIEMVHRFDEVSSLLPYLSENNVVCASVVHKDFEHLVVSSGGTYHEINHNSKLPYTSQYKSMETIGVDRLCNVAAALKYFNAENCLIVDIGTCVKFDFISLDGLYKGGSISPGIGLRYKALNSYTSKLPLIDLKSARTIIGCDTKESIHSGVINGLTNEIEGMISRYEKDFQELKVIITGGDASYFDFPQKSNIFANKNLTLEGIVEIYENNAL